MKERSRSLPQPFDPRDDCPLPVAAQRRNIYCVVVFWGLNYLCAPVSYVDLTHANLLHALGNTDTVSNLPSALYLWLSVTPILTAWLFPHPRLLKPLALTAIMVRAIATSVVALMLGFGASPAVTTVVVIGHAAVFGIAGGVLITCMWEIVRRSVSTSRRGPALGFTFGIGPLFACAGALFQDAVFDGKLLGGRSFGLEFPHNYLAMFAAATPLILLAGFAVALFILPEDSEPARESEASPAEIGEGLKRFAQNRAIWLAVVIYVVVYSGGNAILTNVSLRAKSILGEATDTLGIQTFLRFGCKAVAGGLLGWLLAKVSPRATLFATTSILLLGMGWALASTSWWFMATFGLLGAGELFGAYFPNYVTTASAKQHVRVNLAYMNVVGALAGFSALVFGTISDSYGQIASFCVAAGLLVFALCLIGLLPSDPTPP